VSETPELTVFRQKIDEIDDRLLDLLAERMQIAREVAAVKRQHAIPARIPARIADVLDRCTAGAEPRDLDPAYVRRLWMLIIDETCRFEERLLAAS
jgi:chorismate mutase-like protein